MRMRVSGVEAKELLWCCGMPQLRWAVQLLLVVWWFSLFGGRKVGRLIRQNNDERLCEVVLLFLSSLTFSYVDRGEVWGRIGGVNVAQVYSVQLEKFLSLQQEKT